MDLSQFMKENETPGTRAYEHALDLAYMFVDEMDRQGLSKKELADKMGVSQSRLSNLLNTQPNMTLETIAQFELALGVSMSFELERNEGYHSEITTVVRDFNFKNLSKSPSVVEFKGKARAEFSSVSKISGAIKMEAPAA